MPILVIAEHDNVGLKAATLNTVSAAAKLGADIEVLVAGSNCGAAAEAAARDVGGERGQTAAQRQREAQRTAERGSAGRHARQASTAVWHVEFLARRGPRLANGC